MMFLRRIFSALSSAASGDRVPLAGPAALSGGLEFAAAQWADCEAVSAWCEDAISPYNIQDRFRRPAGIDFAQEDEARAP
jgi:hypothetical protein